MLNIFCWLIGLSFMAGFWLVYGIIVTELQSRRWRRAREKQRAESVAKLNHIKHPKALKKQEPVTVRGYDSPALIPRGCFGADQATSGVNRRRVAEIVTMIPSGGSEVAAL